jgi:phage N-6-adenine-methyltransferase
MPGQVTNLFDDVPLLPPTSIHFSSKSVEWATPQDFFDKLDAEFHFETDVCSTHENAKCENHYTEEEDGLSRKWTGVCWMNPPYARNVMAKWIEKAYESSLSGATVVCLIPARTDTQVWHDYCMKGEVRFIKGRLKFGGCKDSAPFPSAIVIFRPKGNNG